MSGSGVGSLPLHDPRLKPHHQPSSGVWLDRRGCAFAHALPARHYQLGRRGYMELRPAARTAATVPCRASVAAQLRQTAQCFRCSRAHDWAHNGAHDWARGRKNNVSSQGPPRAEVQSMKRGIKYKV